MDNHPIPQDVTGFQFRLIGSMTVKQFGYVAAGVISSVIIFYMPLFILLKILFIPLFAVTGFSLAFIPLEGRPLDAMLGYYIKALLSPNQFIFHKGMGHFSFDKYGTPVTPLPAHIPTSFRLPIAVQKAPREVMPRPNKQKQLHTFLQQLTPQNASPTDKKEQEFLTSILHDATPPPPALTDTPLPVTMPPVPTQISLPPLQVPDIKEAPQENEGKRKEDVVETDDTTSTPPPPQEVGFAAPVTLTIDAEPTIDTSGLAEKEKELQKEQDALRKQEESLQAQKAVEEKEQQKKREETMQMEEKAKQVALENKMTHEKLLELEKSMQEMLSQKQLLEKELQKMKEQLSKTPSQQTFTPSIAKDTPKQETQYVKQMTSQQGTKKGLPPPADVANVLLGVVKDSRENILPNILIEVKDQEGNPVRAFKTNQLGQFASATPLSNGTYTIEFEDTRGKNNFDTIELIAKGEILMPLEVTSHDLRDELRKELFS